MPKKLLAPALAFFTAACGGGGGQPPDVLGFLGLSAEAIFDYQVDVGGFDQAGQVKALGIDPAYRAGVDAYKLEYRQNNILIATRWFQVTEQGLFLLGEAATENSQWVERKFVTPLKMVPYPIVNQAGYPVGGWTVQSDVEQGGSESHRFDFGDPAQVTLSLPAGNFDAFHLVHSRTIPGPVTIALDEYFAIEHWYVRFEYPEGHVWSLAP